MMAALFAAWLPPAQQPAPADLDTATLVVRASQWTARFEQGLSGLLFREQYRQRVTPANYTGALPVNERLLESNVFLLRAATGQFVTYRDAYRVNARQITDHTERLQKLLAEDTQSSREQARRLTDASARHNMRSFSRNINIPTMAFDYLTPRHVGGLRVRHAGRDTIDGLPVVIVEFEELARPTLVRGAGDGDVPARGRYWIHPDSGAVLRARVEFDTGMSKGRMEVRLELHDALKIWVPKEMTEVWSGGNRYLAGLAHYDRFQRLSVATAEIMK